MKPCISQATTMSTPLEADLPAFARAGWPAVELWLTKVEAFLARHSASDVRALLQEHGLVAAAAAGQGGLLLSCGEERKAHWDLFRRRLELLSSLEVPLLVVAADFTQDPGARDYGRAATSLAEAAELASQYGVRLALEFQKRSGFCASLDTALGLIAQADTANLGVCLDVFHYQTGPSKFEDLGYLTRENLAWVQLCDVSGTPRELAAESDQILPGEGDILLDPLLDHLDRLGYDGYVSLEVANPLLWQVPADRVADLGHQALERVLGRRSLDQSAARRGG
jgi:sugar phosphate isomerase/epimerase